MITPDSPDRLYSTRLRTALVLTGSGTAGAYHAGVLRALHEAGVKIDLVAGRGVGVDRRHLRRGRWRRAAVGRRRHLARRRSAGRFYPWRRPLRVAGWALAAAGAVLAVPIALLGLAVLVAIVGLLLTLVGLAARRRR